MNYFWYKKIIHYKANEGDQLLLTSNFIKCAPPSQQNKKLFVYE